MADFVIRVIVDPSRAKTGAAQVKREMRGVDQSAEKTKRLLAAAFAFTAIVAGVRQLVLLSDEFTNIQNRLRVVTGSTEELTTATDALFAIAQRTRSEFRSTAELYSRVSLAARDLGISQQETLQFTESLNQAIILSGASSQEASAGLIQLSQGLASGALRGDELRSVLEQLPVVADVIADELGITRGALRELGAEGKISAEIVLDAFANAREELEERFGKTIPTIGQSFTVLRNSIVKFVGVLDSAAGTSRTISQIIIGLSGIIDDLGVAFTGTLGPQDEVNAGLKLFVTIMLVAIRVVSSLVSSLKTVFVTAFTAVGDAIGGTIAGIEQFLRGNLDEAAQIFDELGDKLVSGVTDNFTQLRDDLVSETSFTIEKIIELWDRSARDIQDAQSDALTGGRTKTAAGLTDEQLKVLEKQKEFIEQLEQTERELQIQQEAGEGAAAAILLYRTELEATALGGQEFVELSLDIAAGINAETKALDELNEARERQESDIETLQALREELRLLELTRQERAVQVALAQLSVDATKAQRAEVEQLAAEIFRLEELEKAQLAFFDQFVRDAATAARSALSGILADPLADGLDQLPGKFAGVLQQLAADFLASEIFKLLSSLGSGEGSGGFAQAIGSFFGQGAGLPGFQTGASFNVGGSGGPDSQIVAFRASPMENVTITPPGQTQAPQEAPNVNVAAPSVFIVKDEEAAIAAIQRGEADDAVMAVLRRNPEAVRAIGV